MRTLKRLPPAWLVVPFVLLFFALALSSLVDDSPTMDEQNHLARGLAFLATGDPRLSLEHPPLVNSLSALPVHALLDVRLPTDHPSWDRPEGWYEFADLLLWEYNHDVTRMIFLARLPIVFLTLGLALVGYRFTRSLLQEPQWTQRNPREHRGKEEEHRSLPLAEERRPAAWLSAPQVAAFAAFLFLLFDPNLLAHGRYTTTDLGGTLFVFLAAFALRRVWIWPGWNRYRLVLAVVCLGLAFGSKLSTLVFVPIFGLLALLPLYGPGWTGRAAGRRLLQLLVAGSGSLLVLWLIFGLQWAPLQFRHQALASLNGISAPMPTFWAGVEQILLLSGGGRPTFLLGESSTEGFPLYFPIAFLVKTPLATLLMLGLALWALLLLTRTDSIWQKAVFLLLPAVAYFLISLTSSLNIGYRHLLPILPFLYLFISMAVGRIADSLPLLEAPASAFVLKQRAAQRVFRGAFAVLAVAFLLPTLSIHPHYLSFFNSLVGGPEMGYQILVDSNVDWGQDLLRLQSWLADNNVDRVKLSWFGTARPAYYGLAYDPLPGLPQHFNLWWEPPFDPADPEPGVYAISASTLWELPLQDEKYVFPYFRDREPDDRVGYSILIYRVK